MKKCPKCNSEMEEGIIADSYSNTAKRKSQWGSGLLLGFISLKNPKDIQSFRCKECDFIENYAKK